jgi:hypothetical protein
MPIKSVDFTTDLNRVGSHRYAEQFAEKRVTRFGRQQFH